MFDPMMIPGIAAITVSAGAFGYARFVLKPRQERRQRTQATPAE